MEMEQKSLRVGAAVICCAVVLRLLGGSAGEWISGALGKPAVISALLLLETGRLVSVPVQTEPLSTEETEPATQPATEPMATAPVEILSLPVFSAGDAGLVSINNACGYETDVASDLTEALSWDLTAEAPSVLILHSHGTECYEKGDGVYRSGNMDENMVAIGDRLVQILEQGGIRAVHDRQLHDSPSYSDAYGNARESIEDYLEQYPTIQLVLDIHRDAVETPGGSQLKFTVDVEGKETARLMLVVGTDAAGLSHPHWPENMSLAVKLHAQLEKIAPGICRPISFRSQRFNQDLSSGAMIVEVGAAGNTQEEAMAAAEILGRAVVELSRGTRGEES